MCVPLPLILPLIMALKIVYTMYFNWAYCPGWGVLWGGGGYVVMYAMVWYVCYVCYGVADVFTH